LHEYVAGIRPTDAPGYRELIIAPLPGGGITSASAHHDSPFGRIESTWRVVDRIFDLSVVIPPSTTATIELPDGTAHRRGPGTYSFSASVRS